MARTSLVFGVVALLLWAMSWSWIVGVGTTIVRVTEVGAIVAGAAAVFTGAIAGRRALGLRLGAAALVLVLGLNLIGLAFR